MADVGSLDSEQLLVLLQEIGKAADKIKTNVVGMGEASTKHMKNAGEAMAGVDKQIVSMTKNLLGPVGLAAGFFAVAKSLDSFAVGQLQLSNLAKNTGLAASSVLQLQTRFDVAGLGAEGFSKTIGGITSALNNIKTFQEQSDVFGKLSQLLDLKVDGQQIANTVLGFEKIGDRLGAINTLVKGWNQGTERQKLYIEELLHTDRAGMEALQQDIKNVVLVTQQGDAEARKYHATWVSIQNTGTNIWNTISGVALREILKITGGLDGLKEKSESVTAAIKQYFEDMKIGEIVEREMKTIRQLQTFLEYIGKLTEGRQFAPGKGPPGALTAEEFLKRQREGDGDQLPKGARPRSYSGADDVDKDSNKVLHDIRDMMQRSEIRAGAGGSGGGGGSSGGGGSGPIFRQGIGGMGGTRGNRNNNRGNIKFGEFAKSMGATHADERGFAVFPDQATGDAAHTALLKQPQYQNLTLDEFGNKYSEGNADWKKTVGKSLGIGPNDKVDTSDPRLLEGIRKAEGTDSSGRGAIPSVILEQAKKAALGGGPNAVFNYIRGQGYNVDSAWCGDFAAAVVKAAGGTPPRNPQVASNWRNYGQEVDAPQPGDIAVRRGARTGDTGSHVTVVESVGKGRFVGVGGNQGRPESQFATNRFQFYRDEAAKEGLDKSMRSASVTGELNANVNFSNVPPGVKTNADGKGFKTLRVTASKQGQKAAEGLMSPGSMEYTPWVP